MRKGLLSLSLAAVMTVIVITGCGKGTESPNNQGISVTQPAQNSSTDQQNSPKTSALSENTKPESGKTVTGLKTGITIPETVLVDESNVKITAKELKIENDDAKLTLLIENNSDRNLQFVSGSMGYNVNSVNGYMCNGLYVNETIAAGKKANETARIDGEELAMYGISEIAEIGIGFSIDDDNNDDYLVTGPISLKTSAADSYDYSKDTYRAAIQNQAVQKNLGQTLSYYSEDQIYDNSGVRITSEAAMKDSSGNVNLLFEVENTGDSDVYFRTYDISVNGVVVSSGRWDSTYISAKKRGIVTTEMSLLLKEGVIDALGGGDVSEIGMNIDLADRDWNTITDSVPVSVKIAEGGSTVAAKEVYNGDGVIVRTNGISWDRYSQYLILNVENTSNQELYADINYDTLSVNDFMVNFISSGKDIAPGKSGLIKASIYDLDDNGIKSASDVKNISFTLKLRDSNYNTIATPQISIDYGQ